MFGCAWPSKAHLLNLLPLAKRAQSSRQQTQIHFHHANSHALHIHTNKRPKCIHCWCAYTVDTHRHTHSTNMHMHTQGCCSRCFGLSLDNTSRASEPPKFSCMHGMPGQYFHGCADHPRYTTHAPRVPCDMTLQEYGFSQFLRG